ncbi:MAG: hypothetical protein AAFV53_11190 [Myxococcota bacterium]
MNAGILLLVAITTGCSPASTQDIHQPFRVFSQNAGTTPYLDLIGASPVRSTCETYYENNLCTTDAEDALFEAIDEERPSVVLLQELWYQPWCEAAGRPEESNAPPFVCSRSGPQLERILPSGYAVARSILYPDNAIAFDETVISGEDELVSLEASCGPPGRIAFLNAAFRDAPLFIAVIHAQAGLGSDAQACRIDQFAALEEVLAALPEETPLIIGGDVNHDVTASSPDAMRWRAMADAVGLQRLEDNGDTARLLVMDLDIVATRGVLGGAQCQIHQLDEGWSEPMFDHASLNCE